jgi:hypothetical protein
MRLALAVALAAAIASGTVTAAQLFFQSAGLMALVLDANGDPVSGAIVHVYPRHNAQRIRGAMTDENGVARFGFNYTAPWIADVCAPYPIDNACEDVQFHIFGPTLLPVTYSITLQLPSKSGKVPPAPAANAKRR